MWVQTPSCKSYLNIGMKFLHSVITEPMNNLSRDLYDHGQTEQKVITSQSVKEYGSFV